MGRITKNRAKIIATIGPATSSVESICDLIRAGMNVARINVGFGDEYEHAMMVTNIRKASLSVGRQVAIIHDLQGPKVRVDKLEKPLQLEKGEEWVIGPANKKEHYSEYKNYIPTPFDKLGSDCSKGQRVFFDNGAIVAELVSIDRELLKIKIKVAGELESNKTVSFPDTEISKESFTEKDRNDLKFVLSHDVDYVAMSVRSVLDLENAKMIMRERGKELPIISRIEKPQGVENLDQIIKASAAIIVARGDLALELGNHCVPPVQKSIINRCNQFGIPVITATQMLDSMVRNSSPTRAEASDVANAIWDGTDALMLSGETAIGKYPLAAVDMMSKTIEDAEKRPKDKFSIPEIECYDINSATMVAASTIAEKIDAKRILAVTNTGNSCLVMSRFRPTTSVLGITYSMTAVRRMCLYWGISPFFIVDYQRSKSDNIEDEVMEAVRSECKLKPGDRIVLVRGDDEFFESGSSNTVITQVI